MINPFQQRVIDAVKRVYPRHVIRPAIPDVNGGLTIMGLLDDIPVLHVTVPPEAYPETAQGYGIGMYIRWREASDVIENGWASGLIVSANDETLGVIPDTLARLLWIHPSEQIEIIDSPDNVEQIGGDPVGQPSWRCERPSTILRPGNGCVMGVDQCAIAGRCLFNETDEDDEGEEVTGEVVAIKGPLHQINAALLLYAQGKPHEAANQLREIADLWDDIEVPQDA